MTATLALLGDLHVNRAAPARALDGLAALLRPADLRFANLEGPLCDRGAAIPHKPNWTHPAPSNVAALTAAGIDVVSCANNVTYPPAAALESLAVLDAAGIAHCGAGPDAAAARRPAVLDVRGTRFAFLARTSICWPYGMAAGVSEPGVATVRATTAYRPDPRVAEVPGRTPAVLTEPVAAELDQLRADVARARARADVVIVSCHWGLPGPQPCDYQHAIGRAAVDAGAAVVVGHGPHTVQPVEEHGAGVILHSLGNSVFDWAPMRGRHLDGLLARCTFEGGALVDVTVGEIRRDAHTGDVSCR